MQSVYQFQHLQDNPKALQRPLIHIFTHQRMVPCKALHSPNIPIEISHEDTTIKLG